MPKLKTNKAAKKRYSYAATGKVKRSRAKSRGKIQDAYADKTCEAGIKKMLPYGN